MTGKQQNFLLFFLLVASIAFGGWLGVRHGDGPVFQVYTASATVIWLVVFVRVMERIQISKMSPAEYAEYKNRPQPESLM